jgi:hypothetical protein
MKIQFKEELLAFFPKSTVDYINNAKKRAFMSKFHLKFFIFRLAIILQSAEDSSERTKKGFLSNNSMSNWAHYKGIHTMNNESIFQNNAMAAV